jgi:predicted ABC-type ATPase
MPDFTVIAGPNGAGKSTFSALLSARGSIIFDPDKIKLTIEKQYPDISEEALENALTEHYYEFEKSALTSRGNFAVETNLRNNFLEERSAIFKEAGYRIRIAFILLSNVEYSIARVSLRVTKKGHFVDVESIRYNFEKGIAVFFIIAKSFDEILLISGESNDKLTSNPILLLTVKSMAVIYINENTPPWAIAFVQSTISNIRRPTGLA